MSFFPTLSLPSRNEGIEWEQIDYFNNKVICDMVEKKHSGIIAVLDEECLRPGDVTDMTFLERLTRSMAECVFNVLAAPLSTDSARLFFSALSLAYPCGPHPPPPFPSLPSATSTFCRTKRWTTRPARR